MKLETLTKEQEALLPVYRDRWLKIGLSTETDRLAAEKAIDLVYECVGKKPPRIKIWLSSPHEGAIGAALLTGTKVAGAQVRAQVWDQVRDQVRAQVGAQVRDQVRDQVGDQVWDQVGDQVWDQVGDQVWDQVGDQVWDQVGDQVGAQVGDQVWDQVGDQVGAQVGDQVRAQVWDQVRDQVYRAGYGSHEAGWCGWVDFYLTECGLKNIDKAKGLIELAKHSGWFWPFENAVILTDKPTEINIQNGRLHNENGAAIKYRDGFSIYSIRGARCPEWIVTTSADKLDPKKVLELENVEHRVLAMRKAGLDRFDKQLKAKVIDKKKDYKLITFEISGERIGPYLRMSCPSTGKVYNEGVGDSNLDPKIQTVEDAIQWRWTRASRGLLKQAVKGIRFET